jgi:hypothetical protein
MAQQHELEVIYHKEGQYQARKFIQVDPLKSMAMFSATCRKMERDGKETLICLRSISEDGTVTLINSHRTHIYHHDPKGSNRGKSKIR